MPAKVLEFGKKVVVLGDEGAGATEALQAFATPRGDPKFKESIGVRTWGWDTEAEAEVAGTPRTIRLSVSLWEVTSRREHAKTHRLYVRGAEGALIFARGEAAEDWAFWLSIVRKESGEVPVAVVVAGGGADTSAPDGVRMFGESLQAVQWVVGEMAASIAKREEQRLERKQRGRFARRRQA